MATLAVQTIAKAGIVPAALAAASAGGDQIPNDGQSFVEINNADATPTNVTFARPNLCSMGVQHDLVVAVANGTRRLIGPFPKGEFDDAGGNVQITYSKVTSLTIGAYKLPT